MIFQIIGADHSFLAYRVAFEVAILLNTRMLLSQILPMPRCNLRLRRRSTQSHNLTLLKYLAEPCASRTHRRRANPPPAGFEDDIGCPDGFGKFSTLLDSSAAYKFDDLIRFGRN